MVFIQKRRRFSLKKKFIFIGILAIFTVFLQNDIIKICPNFILKDDFIITDEFRQMNTPHIDMTLIRDTAEHNNLTVGEVIAYYICESQGNNINSDIFKKSELKRFKLIYKEKQAENFEKLSSACEAVFEDIKVFPVAECLDGTKSVSYADSWFGERTYGGDRHHEGTDIMASVNERGIYPIVSMSDGVIEKIGWLKLGGYRIGIRSPHGGYFYYAHLASYAHDYKIGDKVKAGEVIGYMGDSGYGDEGTVGKFDVHLHLGIYINDCDGNEISINPYNVLKCMENCKKELKY